MNESPVSWIDIASPVVTFVAVILVPVVVAAWVIVRTLTEKPQPAAPPAPSSTGVDSAAAIADDDGEVK